MRKALVFLALFTAVVGIGSVAGTSHAAGESFVPVTIHFSDRGRAEYQRYPSGEEVMSVTRPWLWFWSTREIFVTIPGQQYIRTFRCSAGVPRALDAWKDTRWCHVSFFPEDIWALFERARTRAAAR